MQRKEYTMDGVTMDISFALDYGNVVPFQIDGVKRQLLRGNLTIKEDGKVIIQVTATDALMRLEQTDEGWKITESILPRTPTIHIGGQVTGNNVNIGGSQIIGGKDKG